MTLIVRTRVRSLASGLGQATGFDSPPGVPVLYLFLAAREVRGRVSNPRSISLPRCNPCPDGLSVRLRPGDLSFSTSLSPRLPADALRLLNPSVGLLHRPLPAGGCRSEPSGSRATSFSRRPPLPAPRVAIGRPALARLRLRLAGRSRAGPTPRALRAYGSTSRSPRGRSVIRSLRSACCMMRV